MASFIGKIGGRKFLVAFLGLIGVVVSATTGFDLAPYAGTIIGIAAPYILGQSVVDAATKGGSSTSAKSLNPEKNAAE